MGVGLLLAGAGAVGAGGYLSTRGKRGYAYMDPLVEQQRAAYSPLLSLARARTGAFATQGPEAGRIPLDVASPEIPGLMDLLARRRTDQGMAALTGFETGGIAQGRFNTGERQRFRRRLGASMRQAEQESLISEALRRRAERQQMEQSYLGSIQNILGMRFGGQQQVGRGLSQSQRWGRALGAGGQAFAMGAPYVGGGKAKKPELYVPSAETNLLNYGY